MINIFNLFICCKKISKEDKEKFKKRVKILPEYKKQIYLYNLKIVNNH